MPAGACEFNNFYLTGVKASKWVSILLNSDRNFVRIFFFNKEKPIFSIFPNKGKNVASNSNIMLQILIKIM